MPVKSPPSVLEMALMLPAKKSTTLFECASLKQSSGSTRTRVNRLWWTLEIMCRVVCITTREQFRVESMFVVQTVVAKTIRSVSSLLLFAVKLPMTGCITQALVRSVTVVIEVSIFIVSSENPVRFTQESRW